jgi:DNA mismatch repair ATPase MutS
MMQAGMFVAAMDKGKLDEELDRMSIIIDQVSPGALLLANESFASTNEREGSEIARQVIRALTEDGIRIVFVTHQYDLASRSSTTRPGPCWPA